ncbi:hypothetical protein Tco_0892057 [Tanacetum coccineum]|uniref:Uncharacterized protein n=1 Tax=Tanacetum coccineum TaxID=301880 RepID=A0ABQ5C4R1_9ASTR
MEATSLTMSSRMVVNVRYTTLTESCSSSRALRMFIEQSHDKVYGCLKGGSGNSGGKRLAISMVEEAWLSEKKERKNVSSQRKNVFVEEKECFRRREMESVLTNVVKRLEYRFLDMTFNVCDCKLKILEYFG